MSYIYMTYRFSPIGLTEFMYQRDFRMTTPFDTIPHYIQYLSPNIIVELTSIIGMKNIIDNMYTILKSNSGTKLLSKLIKLDSDEISKFVFNNIPVFSTISINNISDTFYSNLYPLRKEIDISNIDRQSSKIVFVFIENYVHLLLHVFVDIFLHAVLASNVPDSVDVKKLALKIGEGMDDINFFTGGVVHSDYNSFVSILSGIEINKTWTAMKYEFIPNLFLYLDYFNGSPLPIFKLIDKLSEDIVDELYCESEIDTSNLLNIMVDKFTKYGVKFTDKQMNARSLFKLYFYLQLLHSHFHNHFHVTSSTMGSEFARFFFTEQSIVILPLKQNVLSETLPHKKERFDPIYDKFVSELNAIKHNVNADLQFLYDIDRMTWNVNA
jgi:hypothetical protein